MFEFDTAKSLANMVKHGIDFVEAQALWQDTFRLEAQVRRDHGEEERWTITGLIGDRIWTAVITYRRDAIRIISVRRARKEEERIYGNPRDD